MLPASPASSLRSCQPFLLPVETLLRSRVHPSDQIYQAGWACRQGATETPPPSCVGGCLGAKKELLPGLVSFVTLINIV